MAGRKVFIRSTARAMGVRTDVPFRDLSDEEKAIVYDGPASEVTQDVLTAIYGENPVPHSGDESAKQGGARDGAAKEDGRD